MAGDVVSATTTVVSSPPGAPLQKGKDHGLLLSRWGGGGALSGAFKALL
jgi:hypothetical protein